MALQQVGGIETKVGISRLTTEYLYWIIDSDDSFINDTASVAFVADANGKPGISDWDPADIVPNPDTPEQEAVRMLVGPNAVDLTPPTESSETYRVWVRIDTGTEQIVRKVGTLVVR